MKIDLKRVGIYDIRCISRVMFNFFTCACPWCIVSGARAPHYAMLRCYIQLWCHIWTPMMSHMTSSLLKAKPIKGAARHLSWFIRFICSVHSFISVPLLGWGTHACRDWHTDMRLCFWSLLLSKIIDWVVVCYCCEHPYCATLMPLHIPEVFLWVPPYFFTSTISA